MAWSFVHTIVLTDVASGWTECIPLAVRDSNLLAANGGQVFVPVLSLRLPSLTTVQTIDVPLGEQANSESALLLVSVSDGEFAAADRTRVFRKATTRPLHGWVEHVSGDGGARVELHVVGAVPPDPAAYRLTFRQSPAGLVYDVTDVVSETIVVSGGGPLDGTEGPLFGGLRLSIRDLTRGAVDATRSGWSRGEIGLEVDITSTAIYFGGTKYTATATPADYRIEWHETTVGTSRAFLAATELPVSFSVYNVTDDRPVEVAFIDLNGDTQPSPGDSVFLLEPDAQGNANLAWRFTFRGSESATLPDPGDAYHFYTLKPLSDSDMYLLSTERLVSAEPDVPPASVGVRMDSPFPNPFGRVVRIPFSQTEPDWVRLEVFDLLGRRVTPVLNGAYLDAGPHETLFEAGDLPNGVYLVRLTTSTFSASRPITRVR